MSPILIAFLGGLMGMLGYGTSDFFAKKTINKIGDIRTLFYMQAIGTLILLFYFLRDPSLPVFSLQNLFYLVLFGFFDTVGYLALYRAFEVGKVSIVSPVSSCFVVLGPVVSFFLLGETFSTFKIISLILVVIGIFLTAIDLKGLKDGLDMKDLSKGVPEALVVVVIFGFFFPLWDKFIEGDGWMVWLILARLSLLIFVASYSYFIKRTTLGFSDKSLFLWLLMVAVFEAIATFGNSWSLNASENTTSIIIALTSTFPLATAILAYLFLKERLAWTQYLGIAFILSGAVLLPFI